MSELPVRVKVQDSASQVIYTGRPRILGSYAFIAGWA